MNLKNHLGYYLFFKDSHNICKNLTKLNMSGIVTKKYFILYFTKLCSSLYKTQWP